MSVIGACSLCGGSVVMPDHWLSVRPPVPSCERCHAVRASVLPVIPMRPREPAVCPYAPKVTNED